LQIHTTARVFGRIRPRLKNYLLGRYDERLEALQARDQVAQALGSRARVPAAARTTQAASVKRPDARPQSAEGYYQQGLTRVRAGDAAGARRAFQQAQALAEGPLLRRMIEQRLEELGEAL
jgi:Flp pilus assembly protein TadD